MYRIAICDDDLVFGSLLEQYLQLSLIHISEPTRRS